MSGRDRLARSQPWLGSPAVGPSRRSSAIDEEINLGGDLLDSQPLLLSAALLRTGMKSFRPRSRRRSAACAFSPSAATSVGAFSGSGASGVPGQKAHGDTRKDGRE